LVINHYKDEGAVHEINGEQTIEEVSEEIKKVI
jgi:adenylate kinase family enzyme